MRVDVRQAPISDAGRIRSDIFIREIPMMDVPTAEEKANHYSYCTDRINEQRETGQIFISGDPGFAITFRSREIAVSSFEACASIGRGLLCLVVRQ